MRLAWLLVGLLALGCARASAGPSPSPDTPASAWHYDAALDANLGRLSVQLCFEGAVPRALSPGRSEAGGRLEHARWLGPGAARRLPIERGHIVLPADARDGCVAYRVRLSDGGSLDALVRRVGGDLVAAPAAWLWRPTRRAPGARATLKLRLPDGIAASLPWRFEAGRHHLDEDAFRFDSYAAFGTFAKARRELEGVDVELTVLEGPLAIDREAALRWLGASIRAVADTAGGFPRRRLGVIVVPVRAGEGPVPFGMVARGGDASLMLMVSGDADEQALARDWVLPHELSHLLLPFVEREHAWLSEGLATYYQELLRARSGVQSELEALARLLRGAERPPDERSLLVESAAMDARGAHARVYAAGAALLLKADVALRARSRGGASLDAALAKLRARDRPSRVWEPARLLSELDALTGGTVFAEALHEAATRAAPELAETRALLGIRRHSAELELEQGSRGAETRAALFRALHEPRSLESIESATRD